MRAVVYLVIWAWLANGCAGSTGPAPPASAATAPAPQSAASRPVTAPAPQSAASRSVTAPPPAEPAPATSPSPAKAQAEPDLHSKIPCASTNDCWVDKLSKPIARPRRLRGRRFKPCRDGEGAPVCAHGRCGVVFFEC